ncbi:hypothetical protein B0H10DRAFT_2375371 [Mycena sp. CBHHK59/15]|nr:hypothetical protein B0H10DRAFT_2375371 [Mycena sp. CBHHK59/15]
MSAIPYGDFIELVFKFGVRPQRPEEDEFPKLSDAGVFAAQHMPELGHDIKDFQVLKWRLTNWKALDKKLMSEQFECGEHKWRVLLYPFGNTIAPSDGVISVYLECAGPGRGSQDWHVCAQFAIVISNIHDPKLFIHSPHTDDHPATRFIAEEPDWGFTRFSELRKLYQPQDASSRPIIEGDAADITVYVRVLEDPTGVLWHNFQNYDSKKQTGYIGLKWQSDHSFMNPLLQLLYCTRAFRRAVYEIPTEDDIPTESIALALQRVFYHLQMWDKPVGTTELVKSLVPKTLDQSQRDVVELNRILQDKLESLMMGTKAQGVVHKFFVGKMKSYIKCVNVDYESSRIEELNDLQHNVKGLKNLYESLKDYVAVEILAGEYRYHAEGFVFQDAQKGIIIESFPPVLYLQLKRYEYDPQRKSMVKVNDRYEFPFEIDLGEFLDSSVDRSKPWVYSLYGVVVHDGDLHRGHYSAFIKPDRDTRWLRFHDDRVTPVTDKQLVEESYGGKVLPPGSQGEAAKPFPNAYMLVYIRKSAMDEVLAPFPDNNIPSHIKRRLDEERVLLEQKMREREEQHLFLTVKVVTDETFSHHEGFDLATFDKRDWPDSELPSFRVLKQETYSAFKSRVAQRFRVRKDKIRLWVLVNRQNKTVRADTWIPENEPTLSKPYPDPPTQWVMIFLKHFDDSRQTLYGAGKVYVLRTSKVGELARVINERMRWIPSTPLKLYEEIKPGMVELMTTKLTFAQSEVQDGDIICFQVELPEKEAYDIESQGLRSNPIHYYDFLLIRVMIIFRPKLAEVDNDHPEFSLILSKKQNYDIMSQKAGEYPRHDPIKLRFTSTHATNGSPKSVLKRSLNQSIAEIMAPDYIHPTTTHNKEEATHPSLLPKTSMVDDLAYHISKQVTLTATGSQKIRVFQISKDRKTQKEFAGTEMIGNIPHVVELYAEEIPMEEIEADDVDKVIGVFYFAKDVSRTHGVPFKFVIKPGEKFTETKKRLQARIGASDKDMDEMCFTLIQAFDQPLYIEDEDAIYDLTWHSQDILGLDHVDKFDWRVVRGSYVV